jgi:hypothetical protein
MEYRRVDDTVFARWIREKRSPPVWKRFARENISRWGG